jgi:hypothetical protein
MTEPFLQTQWAVCGIAAAAARFLPVPLLDDVVRRRAAQVAVVRTLRVHGSAHPSELFEALWDDREGARRGWRGRLRGVPKRLLLFPVRKYTAVFGAVRGVPNDVARVVLLARTVDRRLELDELSSADRVPGEARALRRAVDEAIDGMDLQLLTAALADGLSRSRGLTTAAMAFVRRRLRTDEPDADVPADGALADGAARVTEVLRRPEISSLLDRFDAQVDERLARRG